MELGLLLGQFCVLPNTISCPRASITAQANCSDAVNVAHCLSVDPVQLTLSASQSLSA